MKMCTFCAEKIQDAAIVCKHCGRELKAEGPSASSTGASKRAWLSRSRMVALAAVLLGIGLGVVISGVPGTRRPLPPPPELVTVTDQVQNVPAGSWKAVPLRLPYPGSLEVSLDVVRGNPLDVFLTAANQLGTMKQGEWGDVRVYTDFTASKTKAFRRRAFLQQGHYYLVMRDTSLGILSSSASNVSLKARLIRKPT